MNREGWEGMTADQRYAARMEEWAAAPGVEFATPEAAAGYSERVRLLRDAIELRKPDRVPIAPWIGLFPMRYAGFTARDAYYDRKKLAEASRRYHVEFQPDVLSDSITMVPGDVFDILDYRMYDWPGHGTPDDSSYQYREQEYMRADEYAALCADPSGYLLRTYLPRVFGALEPLRSLGVLSDLLEMPFAAPFLASFGEPDFEEMLQKLMAAGRAARRWLEEIIAIDTRITATLGMPDFGGGASQAPFDMLADTLRGTQAIMLDRFRRPNQVREAAERLVPMAIEWGVRGIDESGNPLVFMPLHKGADGFMSDQDFRDFYWPTLKAVIDGIVTEGGVPLLFVEGSFDHRLEVIASSDIPAGRTVWMFDSTDMADARRHLGGRACFGGNVPAALLVTGTPSTVDDYVCELLADAGKGGGFILSTGAVIDEARPECFKAMMEAGHRYGVSV